MYRCGRGSLLNIGIFSRLFCLLPSAFQPSSQLLGRAQTVLLADPVAYLETAAEQHCTSERCKDNIKALQTLDDSKALAVRSTGQGMGWSSKKP